MDLEELKQQITSPVRRAGAEENVFITLLSFAATVLLVRIYLRIAGYPIIGRGSYHISHILFGGILLFIAAMLPVIFANRWTYRMGSLLSGIGVGLFIDEVGKFITSNYNYFYPGAAPIIYAVLLLIVLLYFRLKRPPSRDARTQLYHALDELEDVLDHDLDAEEHEDLIKSLQKIAAQKKTPDYARLASELLEFLNSRVVEVNPATPNTLDKYRTQGELLARKLLPKNIFKYILAVGFLVFSYFALQDLTVLIHLAAQRPYVQTVNTLLSTGKLTHGSLLPWYITQLVLEAFGGIIFVLAAILFILGNDKKGVSFGYFGLLLHLSMVNLIIFFYDPYHATLLSLTEVIFLGALILYRTLYVTPIIHRKKKA